MTSQKRYTAAVLTLGCKVSQYESRAIAQAFEAQGFLLTERACEADCIVINTCTVTAESDRKSRQLLHRVRRENPEAFIAVTGCYAQSAPQEIASLAAANYICGSRNKLSVVPQAVAFLANRQVYTPACAVYEPDTLPFEPMQLFSSERTRAYVKIEDGCENRCSYCAIPSARGCVVSKPLDAVLREVSGLLESGYREIVLTGIEVASWGKDFPKTMHLADLCEAVDNLPKMQRMRLGSLYPSYLRMDVIKRLASLSHLAPHLHLSVQSGSDSVLRRMRRRYTAQAVLQTMEQLRLLIPHIMFTADLLVGFPGETEEEFQQTLSFIDAASFVHIHIFPYSRRRGTIAADMPSQLTAQEKARRCHIAAEHMTIARDRLLNKECGAVYPVLFESCLHGEAVGHTPSFLEVHVKTTQDIHNCISPVQLQTQENGVFWGEFSSELAF